jgi:hypothetical protein
VAELPTKGTNHHDDCREKASGQRYKCRAITLIMRPKVLQQNQNCPEPSKLAVTIKNQSGYAWPEQLQNERASLVAWQSNASTLLQQVRQASEVDSQP